MTAVSVININFDGMAMKAFLPFIDSDGRAMVQIEVDLTVNEVLNKNELSQFGELQLRSIGKQVEFYVLTFRGSDFQHRRFSAMFYSHTPEHIIVTMPADEVAKAISWVVDNNPDLIFELDDEPLISTEDDDFMNNRVSARLNFRNRT